MEAAGRPVCRRGDAPTPARTIRASRLAPRPLRARFGPELGTLLEGHGVARSFVTDELEQIDELQLAKTNARSLLGSMNEFAHLADVYRRSADVVDLTALSLRPAETPCSPLYKRHITPHDELMARAAV